MWGRCCLLSGLTGITVVFDTLGLSDELPVFGANGHQSQTADWVR
jgi:hypothetical protein